MTVVALVPQAVVSTGVIPSDTAANSGGNSFGNNGKQFVKIKNADSAPHTATFHFAGVGPDGLSVGNQAVVVAAGVSKLIGPFPPSVYNDPTGSVQVTFDDVTSVAISVLTFVANGN